jgi:O-antigen/teichoic acid export membrane protein
MISSRERWWALINNGLEVGIGLGGIIVITRLFPLSDTGTWFMFIAVFAFTSSLRDALLQPAMVKSVSGVNEKNIYPSLKTSLMVLVSFEMLANIALFITGFFMQGPLRPLLLMYGIYSMPNAWFRWQTFFLRSQLKIRTIAISNGINAGIQLVGFMLLWRNPSSINLVVIILGSASLVAGVYASTAISYRQIWGAQIARQDLGRIRQFGIYAMLREATSSVSSRISLFYATALISLQQTAWLGVSQRFSQLFLLPNNAMQSILFPGLMAQVNQNNLPQARQLFHQTLAQLLALTLPLAMVVVMLSSRLLTWVNGSDYQEAWYLLSVYVLLAAVITPFGTAFGSMVTALSKPQLAFRVVLVNSLINVVLGYFLMRGWGIAGAPLAMVITELFGIAWVSRILKKEANISLTDTWKEVGKIYIRAYKFMGAILEKPTFVKQLWK